MWYDALTAKELQRLHDQLARSLGKLYDVLNEDGLEAPTWADDAAADVRAINDALWSRRLAKIEPAVLKRGRDEAHN